MKTVLAAAMFGAVAAAAVATWSCTVDRKSEALRCVSQSDCSGGRTCVSGYCVFDGSGSNPRQDAGNPFPFPDGTLCPGACSSCDLGTLTCTIDGTGSPVSCPPGWNCDIQCTFAGACGSVDCTSALSCQVTCATGSACGDITCGTGACTVSCEGSAACGTVDCPDSCRCDVTCPAGDCGTNFCPKATGQKSCTTSGSAGDPCDSSFANVCHSC